MTPESTGPVGTRPDPALDTYETAEPASTGAHALPPCGLREDSVQVGSMESQCQHQRHPQKNQSIFALLRFYLLGHYVGIQLETNESFLLISHSAAH